MNSALKRKLKAMTQEQRDAYWQARGERAMKARAGKTEEQLRREYTQQIMRSEHNEKVRVENSEVGIWNDPKQ